MIEIYSNWTWPLIVDSENYEIRPKKHYLEKIIARKKDTRKSYLKAAEKSLKKRLSKMSIKQKHEWGYHTPIF